MFLHTACTAVVGLIGAVLSFYYKFSIINGAQSDQLSVLGTTVQVSVSMMGFMLARNVSINLKHPG